VRPHLFYQEAMSNAGQQNRQRFFCKGRRHAWLALGCWFIPFPSLQERNEGRLKEGQVQSSVKAPPIQIKRLSFASACTTPSHVCLGSVPRGPTHTRECSHQQPARGSRSSAIYMTYIAVVPTYLVCDLAYKLLVSTYTLCLAATCRGKTNVCYMPCPVCDPLPIFKYLHLNAFVTTHSGEGEGTTLEDWQKRGGVLLVIHQPGDVESEQERKRRRAKTGEVLTVGRGMA
jgi:hypothetical protein